MNNIRHRRRVVVSATCFADADAAITIAARLAKSIEGDVLGLLIEEESIRRFAELPYAKALAYQFGTHQPVTSQMMRVAFQRDAKIFREHLAKTAREASLNWSFERRHGQALPLLYSTTSEGDLILLGYRKSRKSSGEIVCVIQADSDDMALMETGKRFARDTNIPFHPIRLTTSEHEGSAPFPDARTSPLFPETVSAPDISSFSEEQLLHYLRCASPTVVFFSMQSGQDFDINALQEAARCPVVLSVRD